MRVMNISKADLGKTLKRYKGRLGSEPAVQEGVRRGIWPVLGGEPFGCLIGDYYFDQGAPDVGLLGEMSKIGGRAHTPFIAGVSPSLMQMDSWQELANPRDLTKIFLTPEYAAWRSLRELGRLALHRAGDAAFPLAPALRLPRSARSRSRSSISRRIPARRIIAKYTWANAAFAMATNINRAFKVRLVLADSRRRIGWCRSRTCRCTPSRPTTVGST
jgi:type VI secretion system protein ImpC